MRWAPKGDITMHRRKPDKQRHPKTSLGKALSLNIAALDLFLSGVRS